MNSGLAHSKDFATMQIHQEKNPTFTTNLLNSFSSTIVSENDIYNNKKKLHLKNGFCDNTPRKLTNIKQIIEV